MDYQQIAITLILNLAKAAVRKTVENFLLPEEQRCTNLQCMLLSVLSELSGFKMPDDAPSSDESLPRAVK